MKVIIPIHVFVAMLCCYGCAIFSFTVADTEIRLATGSSRLLVPDHGFVRHDQIDDFYPENPRDMVLIGITSFTGCCIPRVTANNSEIGWWFFPNGTEIPKIETQGFWTSRYEKEIYLYRRGSRGVASGIYRCDIPVSVDVNETLYVGLYPSGGRYTRLMQLTYMICMRIVDIHTLPTQYISTSRSFFNSNPKFSRCFLIAN